MVTITFYSYKGGVGRSLALANIASRLVEFNKKVCLIDFDLEAPGLQYKFSIKQNDFQIKNGIVDYIFSYANEGNLPKEIIDYVVKINTTDIDNPICLIPAGVSDSKEYWKKLSLINWHQLLYENENGLAFFIDLKEKIKKEINPDFLLIDSRTGISEMSGITLSLMADEVLIIAANNKENLYGAKRIISSILNPENSILGKPPKVTLALSRIPFTDNPNDRSKQQYLVDSIKKDFKGIYNNDIIIIHSDRELEENEKLKISSETEDGVSVISKDYLNLFGKIIEGYLTQEEIKKFNEIKESERIYRLALNKENLQEQLELVNKAIQINKNNINFYLLRSEIYESIKDYKKALEDSMRVLEIDKLNIDAITYLGQIYENTKDFDNAFLYYDKLIELDPKNYYPYFRKALIYDELGDKENLVNAYMKALDLNPTDPDTYNNLANHFRLEKDYEKALEYIYKALELDPLSAFAFSTLAEINAQLNNINGFYLNLELALINNSENDVEEAIATEEIYKNFFKEERFKKLLEKYNISIANVTD